jgi:hypothetical protein
MKWSTNALAMPCIWGTQHICKLRTIHITLQYSIWFAIIVVHYAVWCTWNNTWQLNINFAFRESQILIGSTVQDHLWARHNYLISHEIIWVMGPEDSSLYLVNPTTHLILKYIFFWDVTPCNLVQLHSHFGWTTVNFYKITQCHISEDCIFYGHHCENLKSLAYYCQVDKLWTSPWVEYIDQEGESRYTCLTLVRKLLRKISGPL